MRVFEREIDTSRLRRCQLEARQAIVDHFSDPKAERNVTLQLPTGTGKSAILAVAPFGLAQKKVLILCPNLKLATQIENDLDIVRNEGRNVYRSLDLIPPADLDDLEFYVVRLQDSVSRKDLNEHQLIIANYHQMRDIEKWFADDRGAIDLILIDEAHHQQAGTYQEVLNFFDSAKIIGLTATPFRSDGKKVEGKVIYKYHFHEAIVDQVVRNIRVANVTPSEVSLSFQDLDARTYSLQQIWEMKEEAWFNRGIALSPDCCHSIARKAMEKLRELQREYPDRSHQIIASAMTKRHAREQVKPAFERLGLRVGLVSSDDEDKPHNDRVCADLERGDIDVIVSIGMLGEGFNHPPIGVAAIFRPYKTLNPYIQFVGRAMRLNGKCPHCFVVSHVGLNQVRRFDEFKMFDYEEQTFLEELLGEDQDEAIFAPTPTSDEEPLMPVAAPEPIKIHEVGDELVNIEEQFVEEAAVSRIMNEIQQLDPKLRRHLYEQLGIDPEKVSIGKRRTRIRPIDKKNASRNLLNEREKSIAVDVLKELGLKSHGRDFNIRYPNLAWVKRGVSKRVNMALGIGSNQRNDISNDAYERMEGEGTLTRIHAETLEYYRRRIGPPSATLFDIVQDD